MKLGTYCLHCKSPNVPLDKHYLCQAWACHNWSMWIDSEDKSQEMIQEQILLHKKALSLEHKIKDDSSKEYWYFMTWTHNELFDIETVKGNIEKLASRADKLGIFYIDYVYEEGDKSGREHYHSRVKSTKMLCQRDYKNYLKYGNIDKITIHKHTEDNFNNIGNYMSKQNDIVKLIE